jgi:uncharacterized protein YjiS (DUF1127 family)
MSISVNASAARHNCHPKPQSIWTKLTAAFAVARQRRQLRELDDHMLADIGVTRREAYAEGHKPAWDVPNHWRK